MKEKLCLDEDYVRKLFWDLDLLSDELINQGNYYKKRLKEIKEKVGWYKIHTGALEND